MLAYGLFILVPHGVICLCSMENLMLFIVAINDGEMAIIESIAFLIDYANFLATFQHPLRINRSSLL